MPNKDPRKKPHKIHPNSLKALKENAVHFRPNDPTTGEVDIRINRKGAPDTTASMRALIRAIGADLIQLTDTTVTGKKRTTIASRITKKIIEMYNSTNPADSTAILKAGWPGLLETEEDKRPKEMTLRIVYENKREIAPEEELEELGDVLEGETQDGAGQGVPHSYGGGGAEARWGLDDLTPENENHHTDIPFDRTGNSPEGDFYCVLCKDMRAGKAFSSIKAGGWCCEQHGWDEIV